MQLNGGDEEDVEQQWPQTALRDITANRQVRREEDDGEAHAAALPALPQHDGPRRGDHPEEEHRREHPAEPAHSREPGRTPPPPPSSARR